MSIYQTLKGFLSAQTDYNTHEIEREKSPIKPENIADITESYVIILAKRNGTHSNSKPSNEKVDALNNWIINLSELIEGYTGLRPNIVERSTFNRDSIDYPRLIYRQQLPPTHIFLRRITSEGKRIEHTARGKNTLEVTIELMENFNDPRSARVLKVLKERGA